MKKIDWLLIILNVLILLDGATTYYAVVNGATELNPILAWAFQKLGIGATVFITRFGYMFLNLLLYPSLKDLKGRQFWGIYIALLLVALVVTNNSLLIVSNWGWI